MYSPPKFWVEGIKNHLWISFTNSSSHYKNLQLPCHFLAREVADHYHETLIKNPHRPIFLKGANKNQNGRNDHLDSNTNWQPVFLQRSLVRPTPIKLIWDNDYSSHLKPKNCWPNLLNQNSLRLIQNKCKVFASRPLSNYNPFSILLSNTNEVRSWSDSPKNKNCNFHFNRSNLRSNECSGKLLTRAYCLRPESWSKSWSLKWRHATATVKPFCI